MGFVGIILLMTLADKQGEENAEQTTGLEGKVIPILQESVHTSMPMAQRTPRPLLGGKLPMLWPGCENAVCVS